MQRDGITQSVLLNFWRIVFANYSYDEIAALKALASRGGGA